MKCERCGITLHHPNPEARTHDLCARPLDRQPEPGRQPSHGGTECFRCKTPCVTDYVIVADLRWHAACWGQATDPARIASVSRGVCAATEELIDVARSVYPFLDDGRALALVLNDAERAECWRGVSVDVMSPRLVRAETCRRVRAYCHEHRLDPVKGFPVGRDAVFGADPKLKAAYASS